MRVNMYMGGIYGQIMAIKGKYSQIRVNKATYMYG